MPSTLQQVTDAIKAQLIALDAAYAQIDWKVGEKERSESGKAPRVVWVHLGGSFASIDRTGPVNITVSGQPHRYYPLYTDVLSVECHIWERDTERLERLKHRVVSACRDVLGTGTTPGEYVVDTERERSGHSNHGAKLTLMFTWQFIVARKTPRTTAESSSMVPVQPLVVIDDHAVADDGLDL